jgi:branched-chain amino acid transport system permease protein
LILWSAVQFGRSATAHRWLAVRSNERAAAAIGVAVSRVKLQSIAMSAFIAGIAGALVAYQQRTLSVGSFGAFGSIVLVAIVYLAGIGTPLGALLAGIMASGGVLTVAIGQDASRYQFAVNGAMLVVAAVMLPDGIVGRLSRRRTRSSRRSLAAT